MPAGRPGAQAEALTALVGVAQNYRAALLPHWQQLSAFAVQQLHANQQVRPWMLYCVPMVEVCLPCLTSLLSELRVTFGTASVCRCAQPRRQLPDHAALPAVRLRILKQKGEESLHIGVRRFRRERGSLYQAHPSLT